MAQRINTKQMNTIRFRASRTSSQTTSAATWNTLRCNGEQWDTGDCYDSTSGDVGTFTAPVDGIYRFDASSRTGGAVNVQAAIRLHVNGSTTYELLNIITGTGGRVFVVSGGTDLQLDAGDEVVAQVYTTVATNIQSDYTWFSGHLVEQL